MREDKKMESSERLASSSTSGSASASASSASSSSSAPVVVVVLGATGFLGRLLVREAAKAGYAVRAVVRPSADPRTVAELSKDSRNVAVVRCETVAPPSSGSSSLSVALSGCSAVLCALAGRNNTGGAEGVARMRSVEVDGIVSCFEAFLRSPPPPAPSGAFPRRRFVAFAPPVRQLTRNGTRRPFSEYVVAKEEMEQRLRLAAEAAFEAEREEQQEQQKEAGAASGSSARGGGAADNNASRRSPPAVAVTVFEVAAWGRDSEPIAAALLRSRASLVVSGGANRLQPLAEGALAARAVAGLTLARDVCPSPSSPFSSPSPSSPSSRAAGGAGAGPNDPSPFTVVSVGGPRVLSWRELVGEAGRAVGVEPLFVSVPRWALERAVVPAAELASRVCGSSSGGLSRAGYLARLAADVMATDLVAEEAVFGGGGGVGEAKL